MGKRIGGGILTSRIPYGLNVAQSLDYIWIHIRKLSIERPSAKSENAGRSDGGVSTGDSSYPLDLVIYVARDNSGRPGTELVFPLPHVVTACSVFSSDYTYFHSSHF